MHAHRQTHTQCLLPKLCLQSFAWCLTSSKSVAPKCSASHMAVLAGMMPQRDRRLCTDSSTPLSSQTQHIPGILAGPAPICNSELTRWEHFSSGGTLGRCSLRSNLYQFPAPAKLVRKAERSLAGRMDIMLCELFSFQNWSWSQHPYSVWPRSRFRTYLSCLCCSTL